MLKLFQFGSWPAGRRRWVIRFALAFVVYSIVGFLILPPIIKWQLVKQLPKSTRRTATVRQVLVNPWTLSLTIRGLKLTEPTGENFASWEEFKANFQLSSLFRWAWTFKEIHLNDFHGAVVLQKDGIFNFSNIFERSEPKPESSGKISPVRIFLLSITNGFVSFDDLTRKKPFRTEYRPINILLHNFTTRPGTGTPYSFRAENDTGKTLAWQGDITVVPFSSQGTIDLKNIEPHKYQPYFDEFTRAEVAEGRVDIRADYFVAAGTNGVDLIATNGVIVLRGLKVNDPDANETILSVPELALNDLRFNLRERRLTAASFRITDTEAVTRRNQDNSLNLARLIVPRPTNSTLSTNASAPWTINIASFHLTNASVKFEDRSLKTAFHTQLAPISFSVSNLTTQPATDSAYKFSIATEASEKIDGGGTLSVNPIRSAGEITVAGIELKKYSPFFEPFLRGEILSGKIDVNASYQAAADTNSVSAVVSNTVVHLTDLRLKSPDGEETLVSIPKFSVEGAEANLQDRSVRIARTKTADGSLIVRREPDGKINLVSLLPSKEPAMPGSPSKNESDSGLRSEPTPSPAGDSASPWVALIEEIAVENYSINLEDKAPPKPSSTKLEQIVLNLKNVSTSPEKPISHSLALRLNESAELLADGTLTPRPLLVDAQLSITNLDLRAIQPYLEQHARIDLSHGTLNLATHAKVDQAETNATRLNLEGAFSISNFAAIDAFSQELVQWTNLTVDGIKFNLQPDSLQIDSVRFEGLAGNLVISSNKEINFATIVARSTNPPPASTTIVQATEESQPKDATKPSSSRFPIALGKFELADSSFRVKDASIQPPTEVEIQQVSGAITGLSSDPNAAANVNISGSLGERSPLSVTGRINPLAGEPHFNLTISNSNTQLPQFTSYMEKYTGHPLNRGRLSMMLRYEIEGKQLTAENKVELDQLTLGPRQDNPTATDLPVKLGIALLKDTQGRISLDVPVSGRLDDPQFRLGPIIMKVIVNMIAKAAASPFKLLGAAVGGGEELSYLDFEPGTAEFAEGETNKISKLVKALQDRSGLSLDITGSIDPKRDRDALARQIVHEKVKAARLEELAAINQAPPDPAAFEVEPAEDIRLLRAMVVEQFGTNLSQAIRETKEAMTNNATGTVESSARKQKWYKAVLIPFQNKNSPEAAARRQAKADAALLKENPELGSLSADAMVLLLASKTEVPPEDLSKLLKDRAEAAHAALLQSGELSEDRVLLIAPKPVKEGYKGEARVELSLN